MKASAKKWKDLAEDLNLPQVLEVEAERARLLQEGSRARAFGLCVTIFSILTFSLLKKLETGVLDTQQLGVISSWAHSAAWLQSLEASLRGNEDGRSASRKAGRKEEMKKKLHILDDTILALWWLLSLFFLANTHYQNVREVLEAGTSITESTQFQIWFQWMC